MDSKFRIDNLMQNNKEDTVDLKGLAEECAFWMKNIQGTDDEMELHAMMLKNCTAGDENARNYVISKIKYFLAGKGINEESLNDRIARKIYSENYGLSIIDEFDNDKSISEIFVNGTSPVWIEKNGKRIPTNVRFRSNNEVINIIRRAIEFSNQTIQETNPRVHATRHDNTRVYAAIPPIARVPYLRIRNLQSFVPTEENYLKNDTMSEEMLEALSIYVKRRANILVIGAMSSGKTTLLKFLPKFIPDDQTLAVLETTAELFLEELYPEKNIMSLTEDLKIGITMEDLFIDALRSSADRIICAEARGKESNQLVEAMTRGMEGSMSSIHSSGASEAIEDLARMCLLDNRNRNEDALRSTIAKSINIIVSIRKCDDGKRRIMDISEILFDKNTGKYSNSTLFAYDMKKGEFIRKNRISPRLVDKLAYFGAKDEELKIL